MIYTFSGNQLPAIDNKKTLKKMTKCAEVMGEEGGGGVHLGRTREICRRQAKASCFVTFNV